MIKIYTGTPGSGKSLHSIRLILNCLEAGKNVIANFPLKINDVPYKKCHGRYFYVPNEAITVDYLYQFQKLYHHEEQEGQTLIMIDEASVKFNCRTYVDKDRLQFCSFFAQHRKFGFDVILIAQNMRQVDRQIRDLIEIEVIHRKLNNYGMYRVLPFAFFVAVERNVVIKDRNDYEFFFYSKYLGSLYDTFYDFTTTEDFKDQEDLIEAITNSEIIRCDDRKKRPKKPSRTARQRGRGAERGPTPCRTERSGARRAPLT